MKKIAILGGSFDPITNAHIKIAREIRDKYKTQVLFLVAKNSRWKNICASKKDRLNMLKIALKDETDLEISTLELDKKSNSKNYTIDSVLELLSLYPKHKIYYIIGTDQLNKLDKWKYIDDLAKLVTFLVVNREDYKLNKQNLKKYNCINTKIILPNISSTSIRDFKSKETTEEVYKYIKEKGLYIKEKLKTMLVEKRYNHSQRVAQTAKKIAKANNYDENKAYIAGLIHDCAKNLSLKESLELMNKFEPNYINRDPKLYHQYLAPYVAKNVFGIEDNNVLQAIKFHTTSLLNPTILDKIVYCADKVEPGREFETKFLFDRCIEDINIGFSYVYCENMLVIRKKHRDIDEISNKIYQIENKNLENYELKLIYKTLDDKFASNIKLYDVSDLSPLNKYSFVASCDSDRQLLAVCDAIIDNIEQYHFNYHHKEAQYKSGWVLIDLGDIVVNLFKSDKRKEYDLDQLYGQEIEIQI